MNRSIRHLVTGACVGVRAKDAAVDGVVRHTVCADVLSGMHHAGQSRFSCGDCISFYYSTASESLIKSRLVMSHIHQASIVSDTGGEDIPLLFGLVGMVLTGTISYRLTTAL